MDKFKTSLKKSSNAFEKFFKEPLLEIFHGDTRVVEGVMTDEMSQILDRMAGIDLWFFNENYGVRGIASRVQFISPNVKPYRTFTVRKNRDSGTKTEYEKRKYAIENEWLYPVFTFQGYISDAPLCFAVAKTVDILWMIEHGFYSVKHTGKSQKGQASFYVVKWDDMQKQNKNIVIKDLNVLVKGKV